MNRLLVLTVFVFLFLGTSYAQQDECRAIVLPMFGYDEEDMSDLPAEKLAWHCAFSRNSFDVADNLPQDAVVYDIHELKNLRDSSSVSSDFIVDLDSLSLYAYDFDQFRYKHTGLNVYFHTPKSQHPYLVLRPYLTALSLTAEQLDR